MGNRAVIALDSCEKNSIGIYLHWNGGRDSVEGFLLATKEIMGDRLGDKAYGKARLIECITTFIDGNLSVGVDLIQNLDKNICISDKWTNWDNGIYLVDTGTMEIIKRFHYPYEEQKNHDPKDICETIIRKIKARNNKE